VRARDTATGRVEQRRFYAKIYRKEEEGERTYQVLRALRNKISGGDAGFTVAKPVAYLSGLRTLFQEEVTGTPLEDVLCREDDEAIQAMRKAARALGLVAPRR
jgi:hypothetical protein